jgi:predicted transposase/invertase (TIGR01784 family)
LKHLKITNPILKRDSIKDKLGIVDARAKLSNGKIVHIEIQNAAKADFPQRILFYNSKLIAVQLDKGD